jgi:transcriptional regulator with XRE-family HTH domain
MEPWRALDKTLTDHGIKAADLARTTGLRSSQISRYRRGHQDLLSGKLFLLIQALPLQAQLHFYLLVAKE